MTQTAPFADFLATSLAAASADPLKDRIDRIRTTVERYRLIRQPQMICVLILRKCLQMQMRVNAWLFQFF